MHQEKFVNGAVERGIKKEKAEKIFSLMDKFSDYGFPRSHSVAYAFLAFQTAYLKAHFPEHFYAAVLSSEAQDAAKVFKYSKELRAQGIKLLPPDVNESFSGFTPLTRRHQIWTGSDQRPRSVDSSTRLSRRASSGPFKSFFDFAERLGHGNLNKRVLEGLVGAGAFDSLKPDTRELHEWRGALSTRSMPRFLGRNAPSANGFKVRTGCLAATTEDSDLSMSSQSRRRVLDALPTLAGGKGRAWFLRHRPSAGKPCRSVAVLESREVDRAARSYQWRAYSHRRHHQ